MSEQNKVYIEPIGKSIIAEMMKLAELKQYPSGIVYILEPDDPIRRAKVIALGPDVDILIAVGDTVYYDSNKGTVINDVSPPQIILQSEDIIAREEKENAK
jgi:co-chaperonin GroES (HSP10)